MRPLPVYLLALAVSLALWVLAIGAVVGVIVLFLHLYGVL